ncbi:MAG: hypothetical protein J0I19_16905, partial [Alphaproteobacteria bacterium]|nr:hypothetical protein [Alphaproteobacteria bacterium]
LHGLTGDALNSLRSAFESVFFLGACKEDEELVDQLIVADTHFKKKMARGVLGLEADVDLSADRKQQLETFLAENPEKTEEINVFHVAEKAGLADIYRVYYRSLSHDALHTSISSLDRYLEHSSDGKLVGVRYGPDVDDVEHILASACVVGFLMLRLVLDKFPRPEINEPLNSLWERNHVLLDKTYAGEMFKPRPEGSR